MTEIADHGPAEVALDQAHGGSAKGRQMRARDRDVKRDDLAFLLDTVADGMPDPPQAFWFVEHGINDAALFQMLL